MIVPVEERYLDRVEEAAKSIHDRTTNPLSLQFSEKALVELSQKRNFLNQIPEPEGLEYRPVRRIGIYNVVHGIARFPWYVSNPDGEDFSLEEGDEYLNLHLVPRGKEVQQPPFTEISQTYRDIAEYIANNNLNIKYVMGITYEKLAKLGRSPRVGFTIVKWDAPPDIRVEGEKIYDEFVSKGPEDKLGDIYVCYRNRESYLKQFLQA